MVKLNTKGISVCIETNYQPEYSSPVQFHYVFTYKVVIENKSEHTVQLLRRHWYIHDAGTTMKEVEGEGVVGQQPVLEPGEIHTYVSGCNLKSAYGKMHGHFTMERLVDGEHIEVSIPEFVMVAPFRLN
ncbi:Co2+/Mg2+ efflux protein ApaG [Marivirga sp. S37H4]|uniref:Co2+/Mg2+ efflux protein ApaG n=1 Tax=Marivirga aurantiaca TaxID=2802615 RepID=A0A934WVU5_9BACT|nr:Co2+/Mg2+ efflux protein ApaG [Marivirga aurantiaca]MBK6263984.1 Co2+/Mg2+ efflux protein ApaG [Marivirga aurantiaca]